MKISFLCDLCGKQQEEPGALLFGPPEEDYPVVHKHHVCNRCYRIILLRIDFVTFV